MVWARYSSSSTCIAFVASLLRLLLFAVLFHLLLWWLKITPGGVYHPKGGDSNKGGGLIPQKGWLHPPKGVLSSLETGGFIPRKSIQSHFGACTSMRPRAQVPGIEPPPNGG